MKSVNLGRAKHAGPFYFSSLEYGAENINQNSYVIFWKPAVLVVN